MTRVTVNNIEGDVPSVGLKLPIGPAGMNSPVCRAGLQNQRGRRGRVNRRLEWQDGYQLGGGQCGSVVTVEQSLIKNCADRK